MKIRRFAVVALSAGLAAGLALTGCSGGKQQAPSAYPDASFMEDPKLKQHIERNLELASALGIRGTPAFVIGTQFVPGAVDAAALKQLIADARKS